MKLDLSTKSPLYKKVNPMAIKKGIEKATVAHL